MTFWTHGSKRPFSRSAKTIDGREKRKCQLVLETQNSRAYEKKKGLWTGYITFEERQL